MLTIKLYLGAEGRVADLQKDFPLFQGQYQNVLLNIFVPTSILAPSYKVVSNNAPTFDTAGTAVKAVMQTVTRNGKYNLSAEKYLRYVKDVTKDGITYALYERLLPKEFVFYSGTGNNAPKMIVNVVNVEYATLTSVSITNVSGVTPSYDFDYIRTHLPQENKTYTFLCLYNPTESPASGSGYWSVDGVVDTLSQRTSIPDYGLTLSRNPYRGEGFKMTTAWSDPRVISVITSQTVSVDVEPSASWNMDETITPTESEELEAEISSITETLTTKQDKAVTLTIDGTTQNTTVNNELQRLETKATTNESNIAENTEDISELEQKVRDIEVGIGTGETYIGTMTVSTLPSDSELNAFVQSTVGRAKKAGDTVIVIQTITGATDKNFKYLYGTSWSHYEIPPMELAKNGDAGIVKGTYNIGSANNTLVSIVGGEITDIYIKNGGSYTNLRTYVLNQGTYIDNIISGDIQVGNALKATQDALGNNIVSTYMTQALGASKQFVKEYSLPRLFNDVYYYNDTNISSATPTTPYVIASLTSQQIGTEEVMTRELSTAMEYELSAKNSAKSTIRLASSTAITARMQLVTYYKKNGTLTQLASVISDNISFTGATQTVEFNSVFSGLGETVVNMDSTTTIVQKLYIIRNDSTATTLMVWSDTNLPSTMSLYVGYQAINTAQVVQTSGTSTTAVMSQNAVTQFVTNQDNAYIGRELLVGYNITSVSNNIAKATLTGMGSGFTLTNQTGYLFNVVCPADLLESLSSDTQLVLDDGLGNDVVIDSVFTSSISQSTTIGNLEQIRQGTTVYLWEFYGHYEVAGNIRSVYTDTLVEIEKASVHINYELLEDGTYNMVFSSANTGNLYADAVVINVPETATQGTLSSENLNKLLDDESVYIVLNGVEYHYASTIGTVHYYLNDEYIEKYVCVNENGSWVILER